MFPGLSCYLTEIWIGNRAEAFPNPEPALAPWHGSLTIRLLRARERCSEVRKGAARGSDRSFSYISHRPSAFTRLSYLTLDRAVDISVWLIPPSNTSFLPPIKQGRACEFVHHLAQHRMQRRDQSTCYGWWLICQLHKPAAPSLAPSYVWTMTEEEK